MAAEEEEEAAAAGWLVSVADSAEVLRLLHLLSRLLLPPALLPQPWKVSICWRRRLWPWAWQARLLSMVMVLLQRQRPVYWFLQSQMQWVLLQAPILQPTFAEYDENNPVPRAQSTNM